MIGRVSLVLAAILGGVAIFLAIQASTTPTITPSRQAGKNNTVLFLTSSEHGLGNIMLGAGGSLLVNHPDTQVHVASFADMEKRVVAVSKFASQQAGSARSIAFHPIEGVSNLHALSHQYSSMKETMENLQHPPWFKGGLGFANKLPEGMMPWNGSEYYTLLTESLRVIDAIDPAIVVVDPILNPALLAIDLRNRRYAILSPNAMRENIGTVQPRAAALWKYPATGSGYPYPIPWHLIPANAILNLFTGISIVKNSNTARIKAYLNSKGFAGPKHLLDLPCLSADLCITQALPEADFEMSVIPANFRAYGPIILTTGTLAEQDPEMLAWLKRAPTVLVNLGSLFIFTEESARELAKALKIVLDNSNAQVLWKIKKFDDFSDDFLSEILSNELKSGRLRVEKWIKADLSGILESGHVAVSVHHGGASCYAETLAAGVPHVVLPQWADCYDFASRIEMAGVGIWGSKQTAPRLTADELSTSILTLLGDSPAAKTIRANAKHFGNLCQSNPGRIRAARDIASVARHPTIEAAS